MDSSLVVKMIKTIGLTEYEAKCYMALFERESLTAIEVMNLAGIPRPNTYEALKRLIAKGLCISRAGKPKRFSVSDPVLLKEKALAYVNDSIKAEIEDLDYRRGKIDEKKKIILDNIDTVVSKLQILHGENQNNGNPLDYIEVLKEPLQVFHRYKQLVSEAAKEILVFSKPPYTFSTKQQEDEQDVGISRALKKGATVRSIYKIPVDEEERERLIKLLHVPAAKDVKIRIIENLPMKLAIFDEKVVMFALEDPVIGKPSVTSLIANHHALARSFKFLFESFWEKARSIKTDNTLGKKRMRRGSEPAH